MSSANPSKYSTFQKQLTDRNKSSVAPPEAEVDQLLQRMEERQVGTATKPDLLEQLRTQIQEQWIVVHNEIVEKYAPKGIRIRFDATNFLRGGRRIELEFSYDGFRTCLSGTVTEEAIAFEETRYSPTLNGELASGPVLRLRTLNANVFKDFLCERLAVLLRTAMRRK